MGSPALPGDRRRRGGNHRAEKLCVREHARGGGAVMPVEASDLTGQVFGVLRVLGPARLGKRLVWECRCVCGRTLKIRRDSLVGRGQRQCVDCLKVHGEGPRSRQASAEYRAWRNARNRCLNPNYPLFADYGGRGISMCARWDSFPAFLGDMGRKPTSRYSLDRINVNGDYEPENCRWATSAQQRANRRDVRRFKFRGRLATLSEISKDTGIKLGTLWWRAMSGKPLVTPNCACGSTLGIERKLED